MCLMAGPGANPAVEVNGSMADTDLHLATVHIMAAHLVTNQSGERLCFRNILVHGNLPKKRNQAEAT